MAYIPQKRKTDCGVAALAMLCDVDYDAANRAITWRRDGYRYGTDTTQLREGGAKLGYRTESTPQDRLKPIQAPKGWTEEHGTRVDHRIWSFIPDNSLVKVPQDYRNWHWVVWRNPWIYDPSRGIFAPRKYQDVFGLNSIPSSYMQFIKDENFDPCPKCGSQLTALSSGVKCPKEKCDYWFCY